MKYYIYSENAVNHNGSYVNSYELKGERPAWIPRQAWALAYKFVDLGAKDVFFGVAGEKWRVREEIMKNEGINRADYALPRSVRSRTRSIARN